ncbi:MAG: hypothetical protein K1X74_03200 [Pirellulales bacterium]|nr:hypothetical protein [Pirellulales bacterium]
MASDPTDPPPRWRLQFGLGTLLLVMLLVGVAAAALGGLLRATASRAAEPLLTFVLLTIAAPLALLMVISLLHTLTAVWRRRKR